MIPTAKIDNLFRVIGIETGYRIIRADQDILDKNRPKYPYLTFRMIDETPQTAREHLKTDAINGDEPTLIDVSRVIYSDGEIMLDAVSKENYDDCRTALKAIQDYIDWYYETLPLDATIKGAFDGININIIDRTLQNKTIQLDNVQWEYKWGFNFNFNYRETVVNQVEAIKTINIDNETAGRVDKIEGA